jgi:hypothetical protein
MLNLAAECADRARITVRVVYYNCQFYSEYIAYSQTLDLLHLFPVLYVRAWLVKKMKYVVLMPVN